MRLLIAAICSFAIVANAQDAGMQAMQMAEQANQQAMQAAQQANQQAMQMSQQASEQINQQMNEQAALQATQSGYCCGEPVAKPSFSIKPGVYSSDITVKLKDRTRRTVIFYTTDGWSPTTLSTRYAGPIVVSASTTLQAIAIGPNYQRSPIAFATYTLPAKPQPAEVGNSISAATSLASATQAGPVLLKRGTPVTLVFTSAVTSKGKEVGDTLPVALAKNLVIHGILVAPEATPVLATITQVDSSGIAGAPGVLSFAVHSMNVDGKSIALSGFETKEGEPRVTASRALMLIPYVGISGVFIHGHNADIPQGATLTAYVNSDTSLGRGH